MRAFSARSSSGEIDVRRTNNDYTHHNIRCSTATRAATCSFSSARSRVHVVRRILNVKHLRDIRRSPCPHLNGEVQRGGRAVTAYNAARVAERVRPIKKGNGATTFEKAFVLCAADGGRLKVQRAGFGGKPNVVITLLRATILPISCAVWACSHRVVRRPDIETCVMLTIFM